ncbi:MAG: 30S ribosomal protein S20 [Clostridiales bacterium]|jgi:small subunit ribosomal protein S20|nr:30S ribosomal protein S20 [Clostridiales bacterium]
MPNIKSAKKRVKVIATKSAINQANRSALKTQIKKANIAVETNAEDMQAEVQKAVKKIDQAVAKGLLHKNTAARRKSALARKINIVGA